MLKYSNQSLATFLQGEHFINCFIFVTARHPLSVLRVNFVFSIKLLNFIKYSLTNIIP